MVTPDSVTGCIYKINNINKEVLKKPIYLYRGWISFPEK
jgi:hypothetical protein